jgi:signal transduction histidine kinase
MGFMTARRTLAIAAAALLCGVGDVLLVLGSEHLPDAGAWAVFGPVVGWSFVGTGLYTWRRRPESRFGLLMVLVGFAWFLGPLYAADSPLVFTLGIVVGALWGPVFGHVLLSFPTGRLATRARRRVVAASYVLIPLAPVPALLVSDADDVITDCRRGCPRNVLLIGRDEGLRDAALALGSALTLGLCLVAVGMLLRRWRAAAAPERRSLVPLFVSGGVTLALVAAYVVSQLDPLLWMAFAAFAATPFAFLAGLARADLSGSRGVRMLMAELGDMPERADLRDALARALGDPGLELAFWMPELNCYVDADGAPAELPGDDDARRTATEIDHHDERVGAIVHDRAQHAETVRAAGAATALLLENQRLDAELRARLIELLASRARLVEAADGERRRLERNLHDGAQSRLVALALNLRLARMGVVDGSATAALLDTSIDELGQSLGELRDLARGIHPAVLSERGLEPALRALAARAAVPVEIVGQASGRLPAAVETAAYFVVSEALTNVSKYAHAARATVRVERVNGQLLVEVSDDGVGGASASDGSGLRGLSDRVAALSGTLEVSSPPGRGTRLRAHLPCE